VPNHLSVTIVQRATLDLLTARFGELYGERNKASTQGTTTSLLCKLNSDRDFVFGKAENNKIVRSALDLGKLVLQNLTMFGRVADQAPGQCIDLLQQLSNAGCELARERLDKLQPCDECTEKKGTCELYFVFVIASMKYYVLLYLISNYISYLFITYII